MRKFVYFLLTAILALGFASCSKDSDLPEVPGRGVSVNISIADLVNDGESTRAIKSAWAEGDKLNIWFDGAYWTQVPQLVLTYDGAQWTSSDVNASVLNPTGQFFAIYESTNSMFAQPINSSFAYFPQGAVGIGENKDFASRVPLTCYSNNVGYTFADNEITASISAWEYLTQLQVVITDLPKSADHYALKINDVDNIAAYRFYAGTHAVSSFGQTNGQYSLGVPNQDGVAFLFGPSARPEARDITYTLLDIEDETEITYTEPLATLRGDKAKIQAIKLPYSKFGIVNPIADEERRLSYGITFYNQHGDPLSLSCSLLGDYTMVIDLPSQSGNLVAGANVNTLSLYYNDEQLGTNGPRTAEQTLNTGVNGVFMDLETMSSHAFNFAGCQFPIRLIDNGAETSGLVYDIQQQPAENVQYVGAPNDRSLARSVWNRILTHIDIVENTDGEAYVHLPRGAQWHMGDETMEVKDDITLSLTSDRYYAILADALKTNCQVNQTGNPALLQYTYPAGTVIAFRDVKVVFKADTHITYDITALGSEPKGVISAFLQRVATAGDNRAYLLYMSSFSLQNQIIGMLDACDMVPVTIEFTK